MSPNADQIEFWNSDEAAHWVRHQDRYDGMLAPFTTAVLELAALASGDCVLDVGCGTGFTTCEAARIARDGATRGVDVSAPMIEAARNRAGDRGIGNVEFVVADAQVAPFEADRDVIISRFGVMFFDDPVAAFANLRRALRADGRVAFACWRPMLENEWMAVPCMAALAHVTPPAPPGPDAPGPFAFGDRERVARILTEVGYRDVTIEPFDTRVLLAGGGTVDDAMAFIRSTGMGRLLLADPADPGVAAALDAMREALGPHATSAGVELGAATWLVSARA
jgi:SAM-dependent methyltransferase